MAHIYLSWGRWWWERNVCNCESFWKNFELQIIIINSIWSILRRKSPSWRQSNELCLVCSANVLWQVSNVIQKTKWIESKCTENDIACVRIEDCWTNGIAKVGAYKMRSFLLIFCPIYVLRRRWCNCSENKTDEKQFNVSSILRANCLNFSSIDPDV